ncbi:MAG: hypothetical protein BWY42_00155 [Candidatus Omnitrophica bacterium ADurb.Bin277]|nr:MAG: hypothetical protein BWY42_00155 [Candidatus Omnitrophica bacterium ADurb.Bin277]
MPHSDLHLNVNALEQLLKKNIDAFAAVNPSAKVILRGLSLVGIGFRPVLDHLLFRTTRPSERVREFTELGYSGDPSARVMDGCGNPVSVYRCRCLPAILIEEARGKDSREWVRLFGDSSPYMLGMKVDSLEEAAFYLEKQAVRFLRPEAGKPGEEVRAIAALPVFRDGAAVNVLVLVERHAGNTNYYGPDFWSKA